MKHPIISYADGTEVTASSYQNGKVRIYTEKWDDEKDKFISAEIVIPDAKVVMNEGYSEEEISNMLSRYTAIQSDIIDYIKEKETISA